MEEPGAAFGSRRSSRRLAVGVLTVAGLVGAWLVGSAVIPRWWAQRIGDQVGGSILGGTLLGLGYGLVFTLLPLAALVLGLPRARTWRTRGLVVAAAVVLALPNLFTLGIVAGVGNASHAADRTLDVEAPAFRGGTLAGALAAAGLVLLVAYARRPRRETGRDE